MLLCSLQQNFANSLFIINLFSEISDKNLGKILYIHSCFYLYLLHYYGIYCYYRDYPEIFSCILQVWILGQYILFDLT